MCRGGDFDDFELQLIRSLDLIDHVIQIPIHNDSVLRSAYAQAKCFVLPSLHEGFGIPILEAFACGCPVVVANNSCFPEIAGKAALYYEPQDDKDLSLKVGCIISDKKVAEEFKILGYKQLKKYSWEKTVMSHKYIYEQAAGVL